ncbi:MAG: transposase, partial [Candidatus Eisenbacteria bacterium]|nr:transposase [Candidatus Eisenbacteria bacterium]
MGTSRTPPPQIKIRAILKLPHSYRKDTVFLPKYRRGVLTEPVFTILRKAWETVCREFECELEEANYEPD